MITREVTDVIQEVAWNVDLRRELLGISNDVTESNPDGAMKAVMSMGTIGFHTADVSLTSGDIKLTGKDTLVTEACPPELIAKLLAIGPALEEAFEYRRTAAYAAKVKELKEAKNTTEEQ